jgi:hypothetical protein
MFIHPNPNVCTLFIQKIQLFPLEILDFFNEFLKSVIRRDEPYSENYHKCKMYERNIPGNIQRIKFQSDCLENRELKYCNFACDLCCFIVNVFSVKISVELMLYCFIMCRIKIKFSYSYYKLYFLFYYNNTFIFQHL